MAFIERVIQLTFTRGAGVFASSGKNQMTVSGLRVLCSIANTAGIALGQAQLRIYGLELAQMNELSALNSYFMVQELIELEIRASDETGALNLIFDGQVMLSQIDLNSQPDSALVVVAQAGALQALQIVPPTSYPGTVDHLTILKDLASKMGLAFEPNGTPVSLSSPYFPGSLRDQAIRCADAANINLMIDLKTLIVWPKYGSRAGQVPLISPSTGLVGYPGYSGFSGITVKSIFNPFIRMGAKFKVQSQLKFANATWTAYNVHHDLESQVPGGKWFTSCDGAPNVN
jgi:hypothetical protein